MAEFTENEVKPIAAETDAKTLYPRENIEKLFDLGVMGMCIPKEYGGQGADPLASAICIEELSKQCASTGDIVATHNGLCCDPILTHGTDEQKAKYLPMLSTGHKVGAFALTEPNAGSDASKGQTEAKLEGDHYVMNGSKIFITNGYVADVSDEDAVNAMVAKIKAEVGPVDILVNNAGLMKRVPMTEMSHADFMRVIDVHVGGAFNCSKAVLPDMMEKREGKIINICSMMSELGRETVSAYAAAKGGLKMLTKNIASEYGEYNIQCNGMGPGYIATAQTAPLREVQPDGSRHPFDQFITAKTPAGRWGEPDDMVGPCVFLASHASDFVNGQILYADGGILAYIGRQPK